MTDRTFRLFDATLVVAASTDQEDRRLGGGTKRPDWETFNRVHHALEDGGFAFGPDPLFTTRYRSLSKYRRLGSRETPQGTLFVATDLYPVGCKFEFFQEVVTINRNGGRYDFDRIDKMPYLIRKAFDAAIRRARAHLLDRGFADTSKLDGPNPEPLTWFNQCWDSEYERQRGTHRFERGPDGWPTAKETTSGYPGRIHHPHGSLRYFRHHNGRMLRGRVYGGINGMWTVICGPGRHDVAQAYCTELFEQPLAGPRRLHPGRAKRLAKELARAVERQNFERAIVLRDIIARDAPLPARLAA